MFLDVWYMPNNDKNNEILPDNDEDNEICVIMMKIIKDEDKHSASFVTDARFAQDQSSCCENTASIMDHASLLNSITTMTTSMLPGH